MIGANGESSVAGKSAYEEFLDLLAAETAPEATAEVPPEPARPERVPRVFGRYTLLRERGRGSLGVVYEALSHRTGKKVAVKILLAGVEREPGVLARFRREPGACARVRHPNVVEVLDAGEIAGRPFYAMELLSGESLAELVRAGRVPPARPLCRSLAGIADALHAMHGAGVLHRDVNPSNIVVQADGRMVLADFGLARTGSISGNGTGGSPGTPLYMSPEQIRGDARDVDARTDVYALGATLYEALTGRPVFATGDFETLARMILDAKPRPLREFLPDLPLECERIVLRALEKDRADRPASAAVLRDELLSFALSAEEAGAA